MSERKVEAVYAFSPSQHRGAWVQRHQVSLLDTDTAESLFGALEEGAVDLGGHVLAEFPDKSKPIRFKAADPDLWAKLQLLVVSGGAIAADTTFWDEQ